MQSKIQLIHSPEDIEKLVNEMGLLPFFNNELYGFSLVDHTPDELYFPEEGDGIWEWKGPAIVQGGLAYGKFFNKKAGFISMDWFPDFANWRRHGKDKLTLQEKKILEEVKLKPGLLSRELKRNSGYRPAPRQAKAVNALQKIAKEELKVPTTHVKSGKESFETAITHLQMMTYVITADFQYNYDKEGKRYGWGVARYCTPEDFFGEECLDCGHRTPQESYKRIVSHLQEIFTDASEEIIKYILG